jgi:Uma2 family endonuclease
MEFTPTPTIETPEQQSDYISFEDYLREYNSYEGGRTEWMAGEVAIYPIMSNNLQHNDLIGFLYTLLSAFLELTRRGQVVLAGVPMKYSNTKPAREPDLMIVLTEHAERLLPKYIDGIADIVVEVVSPESVERDYADKLNEYEAAGVPEYWLFDPERETPVVHVLGADGRYRRAALDGQGRLVSEVLRGFALDPALLWQTPYPGSITIVRLAEGMITPNA